MTSAQLIHLEIPETAYTRRFDVDPRKLGDYIEQNLKGGTGAGGADNVEIDMQTGDITINGDLQSNVTDVE